MSFLCTDIHRAGENLAPASVPQCVWGTGGSRGPCPSPSCAVPGRRGGAGPDRHRGHRHAAHLLQPARRRVPRRRHGLLLPGRCSAGGGRDPGAGPGGQMEMQGAAPLGCAPPGVSVSHALAASHAVVHGLRCPAPAALGGRQSQSRRWAWRVHGTPWRWTVAWGPRPCRAWVRGGCRGAGSAVRVCGAPGSVTPERQPGGHMHVRPRLSCAQVPVL